MSIVELRNQNRKEQIRKIRALLFHGDQVKIAELSKKSIRTVTDTLNEDHPLFSQVVIDTAWEYIRDQKRIPETYNVTAKNIKG